MSKTQVNKLGRRLRDAASLSTEDLERLDLLRADYFEALRQVQQVLVEHLGLHPTSRPEKTVQTMVDKLRRNPSMQLSNMQDVAGTRVVADMTWAEQDAVVARIESQFQGAKVIDRRAMPSFGYRAVHVVVTVQDCPVEIQVRTRLQDLWAQVMERLADQWGRQIRYGGAPGQVPARSGAESEGLTRSAVVQRLMGLSAGIARLEERRTALENLDVQRRQAEMPDPFAHLEDPGVAEGVLRGIQLEADRKKALAEAQLEQVRADLQAMTSQDFWDNLEL